MPVKCRTVNSLHSFQLLVSRETEQLVTKISSTLFSLPPRLSHRHEDYLNSHFSLSQRQLSGWCTKPRMHKASSQRHWSYQEMVLKSTSNEFSQPRLALKLVLIPDHDYWPAVSFSWGAHWARPSMCWYPIDSRWRSRVGASMPLVPISATFCLPGHLEMTIIQRCDLHSHSRALTNLSQGGQY